METWISLLRGINVGGKNILPMRELRSLLNGLGFKNVQTYIQSGNCVFEAADADPSSISDRISKAIHDRFQFESQVMTFSKRAFSNAIDSNPYPEAEEDPKSVHLYFLSEAASNPDLDALAMLRNTSERFTLTQNVFFLLAPEGIGRSKLAAQAEGKIGVTTTARNYRTVLKLAELAN